MKVSFVATVYNEESTIKTLLQSLFAQSKIPDEIIIVDGGSTDNTVSEISSFKFPLSDTKTRIKLIFKKGNISVGRNEAIKNAGNEIIVCSDAGCILDKYWTANITRPFKDSKVNVVAGYYRGIAKTNFQRCLIPYALVMPDKVDEEKFLPATRSMAFKKYIWKKIGGFDEKISYGEDYVFAKKLRKFNANIRFEKKAIVGWIPRDDLGSSFVMFYRLAKGDAQGHVFRIKVSLIFLRYLIGIFFIALYISLKSQTIFILLCLTLFVYILWSIIKNYKYVKKIQAILFLPLLQITSDVAVILGTISGIISFYKLRPGGRRQP